MCNYVIVCSGLAHKRMKLSGQILNKRTVELANFRRISNRTEPNRTEPNRTESNRTELSRTNSILSRRTVPELLRIF